MFFLDDDTDDFSNDKSVDLDDEIDIYIKSIRRSQINPIEFDLSKVEKYTEFCIEHEKFAEGLEICRHWLEKIPESTEALNKQAFILLNLDRSNEALNAINKSIQLSPTDNEAILMKALILDNAGKHKEALTIIEKLISEHPGEEDFLYAYGNILQSNAKYQKALEIYLTLTDNSDIELSHLNQEVAFCYNMLDKHQKAIYYYEKAIEEDPFDANIWYNKGIIHSSQDDTDEAITCYEFAVAIDNDFFLAWFNLAFSYSDKEMLEKSISAYREALRIKPTDIDSLHNLASVLGDNDQLEDAKTLFINIIDLYPSHVPSLYGLGLCYESEEEYEKADTFFDKAISQTGGCPEAMHSKALMYRKMGELEKSIKAFEKALTAQPNDRQLLLDFVRFLFELKQYEILEKFLIDMKEHFKEEGETYPEIFFYLSAIYAQKDDIKQSEKYLIDGLKVSKQTIQKLNVSLQKMMNEFSKIYLSTYRNN